MCCSRYRKDERTGNTHKQPLGTTRRLSASFSLLEPNPLPHSFVAQGLIDVLKIFHYFRPVFICMTLMQRYTILFLCYDAKKVIVRPSLHVAEVQFIPKQNEVILLVKNDVSP